MYAQALTIISLTIMEYYSKLVALLKKLYEHVKVKLHSLYEHVKVKLHSLWDRKMLQVYINPCTVRKNGTVALT